MNKDQPKTKSSSKGPWCKINKIRLSPLRKRAVLLAQIRKTRNLIRDCPKCGIGVYEDRQDQSGHNAEDSDTKNESARFQRRTRVGASRKRRQPQRQTPADRDCQISLISSRKRKVMKTLPTAGNAGLNQTRTNQFPTDRQRTRKQILLRSGCRL